jgi:N-methylhydantoinase A
VADGLVTLSADGGLAGERIALRSLDIASLAAGGGSIASVASNGIFRVGPESAGAAPGPAAYGQGGQAATVTDANVVLGYLDAKAFMGGKRPLDVAAAEAAVDRVASALNISRIEAAFGIFRLVNLKMADGIRLMTVRRGVDPRRFALLSFGGAAGLHAAELARELDIARIIVPTTASVLSAWGMLTSDLRYEQSRTHFESGARTTAAEIKDMFSELETRAVARLKNWFAGEIAVERSAEMRYGEQIFELDVPLDGIDLASPSLISDIEARFHLRHEELYTYASRDQEVVFVNARVAAIGKVFVPEPEASMVASGTTCAPRSRRNAYFGAWREVDVFALDDLNPGATLHGPAIIEAETTTVVINEGDRLQVNALGWLDISVGGSSTS